MKIWAKTEEFKEGKYLVVRRDGTVPPWPHFVLGGYDPCAAEALHAYAKAARARGWDDEYAASVEALACEFESLAASNTADPWAGPHRVDLLQVLQMMRHESDMADLVRLYLKLADVLAKYVPAGASASVKNELPGSAEHALEDHFQKHREQPEGPPKNLTRKPKKEK